MHKVKSYRVKLTNGAIRKHYDIVDETGTLVEGGFFTRSAAEASCAEYNDEAQETA